jgi:hypothetical protein
MSRSRLDLAGSRRRSQVSIAAALAAIPFYIFCCECHVCRCGHLLHPPIHRSDYVNDALWGLLFVISMVFAVRSSMCYKMGFLALLLFLILSSPVCMFGLLPISLAVLRLLQLAACVGIVMIAGNNTECFHLHASHKGS